MKAALARLFHDWEHRLASVSTDRIERPFEWGLDWLPEESTPDGAPYDRVARWVRSVMADTQAFFTPAGTPSFTFDDSPSARQAPGQAGTLRFSSALTTPHEANNIVVGRWFPSTAARESRSRSRRGPAVIVMPQWNADAGGHIGLAQLLARCGISALRLSLPYHDARMPPELSRADYIVSSNVVRTLQACRQAVLDARRAIDWLEDEGFDRVGMLGTSLGSCLSMLTTVHEPRVRAAALNHVSPWFADVVWRGLSTRHVRAGLDGHITLEQLRELWQPISPYAYLERQWPAHSLLVYASYDLTFPVDLSRTLVNAYKERGIAHDVAVLPCGHYSSGRAPFKFLDAWMLIRYLRRQLL
jgi:dienelactone hydrolase